MPVSRLQLLLPAVIGISLITALEFGLPAAGVAAYLLPTPSQVWRAALQPELRLAAQTLDTLQALSLGLLVSIVVAAAVAVLFVLFRPLETALWPLVLVSQSLPTVTLAPLLAIWLGDGLAPRVVMAALFAGFPLLVALLGGLRRPDQAQLDILRVAGATRRQQLLLLRLPAALPSLFRGLRIAAPLAVIGTLIGEMAGGIRGLGYVVTVASYRLAADRAFAAISTAVLISLMLTAALALLERRFAGWDRDR
jgi:NitT/TauT family transport system permease protein